MRFQVRTGGMIAILVGVAVLSGSVFLLGILAGYDIGRETQNNAAQVATDYTLESSPAAAAPTPMAAASASGVSAPELSDTTKANPLPSAAPPTNIARASVAPTAVLAPKPTKPVMAAIPPSPAPGKENIPPETSEPAAAAPVPTPEPKLASNPTPVPHDTRRKPFNIQIQAAMDAASASQMIKRLHILGYEPHTVPTTINGATWYKVEVGPYATQAEAAAAQAELKEKYDAMFAHPSAPAPAPAADSQDE